MWGGRPRPPMLGSRRSARMTRAEVETRAAEAGASGVFLTAEWRGLIMLNYAVDPQLLKPHVPSGTLLDSFHGVTCVSLVGFRFCCTRLLGRLPLPFHSNFDEVNLRFYVRREVGEEQRRGVVFIAEVVPRLAIALTARAIYGENYKRAPMRHLIESCENAGTIEFQWKVDDKWCRISARRDGIGAHPESGSLEQFITEHYWGYSRQRGGTCLEYRVEHVPWRVWKTSAASVEGDASSLYGEKLGALLRRQPDSSFIAEGSPITVFTGRKIE